MMKDNNKEQIFVTPLVCTRCERDMGAILCFTMNVDDAIKIEKTNLLCKNCYETLQDRIRKEGIEYFHINKLD